MLPRLLALALALFTLAIGAPAAGAARPAPDDRYIVVLKDGAGAPDGVAREHGRRHGASVKRVYSAALNGYVARLSRAAVADLRVDPRVAHVERDRVMHASVAQSGATWGLDRVDQRYLPLSYAFNYSRTGAGVRAYVIDTGLRPSHAEFGGRAVSDVDFVDPGNPTGGYFNYGKDCNGHGTHVGATIGGRTYGVAKAVSLVGVRVLDCDGSGLTSEIIAGVDWVTAKAARPAVVNMSLGGGASRALDDAVRRSIARGLTYVVAAGNAGQNACYSSPARLPDAVTISASDAADRKPSWANYGSCVDWFAPGASITSASHTSDNAITTISGTSMAAPHTAGVVALYLESNPSASPSTVRGALYSKTTKYRISYSRTSNNHLLFTNW